MCGGWARSRGDIRLLFMHDAHLCKINSILSHVLCMCCMCPWPSRDQKRASSSVLLSLCTFLPRLLVKQPLRGPVSDPPVLEFQACTTMLSPSHGYWGSEITSMCLQSKYSYHRATQRCTYLLNMIVSCFMLFLLRPHL